MRLKKCSFLEQLKAGKSVRLQNAKWRKPPTDSTVMEPKYVRIPMFLYIPTSIRSLIFHGTGCNQHSAEFPLMGLNCVCHVVYDILLFLPSGQKMLEMLPAPKRDCLKLSVMKFRNCFRQSPRWLTRESLWNSELDSRANSHNAFGQLFWFSGKCVFVQKVLQCSSKTPSGRVQFLAEWVSVILNTTLAFADSRIGRI